MANPLQFIPGLNLLHSPDMGVDFAGNVADVAERIGGSDIMPGSDMARRIAALRAIAAKNPELAAKLAAQGSAVASAPERNYNEDMWPGITRASTPSSQSNPSVGTAARIAAGAHRSPLDNSLATYQSSLLSGAAAEKAIAEQNAIAALVELGNRKSGNMEEAYAKLRAENKRAPVDPLRASNEGGSAPVFRALAEAGPALLGSGNIQKGMSDFGSAMSRNWTAEEARSAEERKQNLLEGVTGLGFREKDINDQNARSKELLAAQQALLGTNLLPVRAVTAGAEKGLGVATEQAKLDNALKVAGINASVKNTPLATAEGMAWLAGQMRDPEKAGSIQSALSLLHPHESKAPTKELIEVAQNHLATGKIGNKIPVPADIQAKVLTGIAAGKLDPLRAMEYGTAEYKASQITRHGVLDPGRIRWQNQRCGSP